MRRQIIWLSVVLLVCIAGCGQSPTQKSASVPKAEVPLPEWAPENPSPEFLRAARMLKPLPSEILGPAAAEKGISESAMMAMVAPIWGRAYEFFGSLSDDQMERLRETGVIRLPVRSLAAPQREAMERFIATRDDVLQGDLRVTWFKSGAGEDLSNVDVGFALDGHVVAFRWWVRNPDDPESEQTGRDHFATL